MARWPRLASPIAGIALIASIAAAQEPKTGDFYECHSLAFKVKVPAKWQSVPPDPNERNLVVKFDPPGLKYIQVGSGSKQEDFLTLHCWIVKFDQRSSDEPKDDKKVELGRASKNVTDWVTKVGECGPGFKLEGKAQPFEANKVPANAYVFSSTQVASEPVKVYAAVYSLEKDLDVAVVFNGPAEARKWNKWENAFEEMARSFRKVDIKDSGKPAADTSKLSLRDKRRMELETKLKDTPEWKLYPTPNYFIISNNTDRAFLDELQGRLEAIHSIYMIDYPIARAKELREQGKALRTAGGAADKEGENDGEASLAKAILGDADPQELAKCSVVRVCKSKAEYMSYGGPPSSAGYWNWVAQELVLYDDKAEGGRGDTWSVLNHEAFHQYIFYLYGNISPQSWYNEGTGDFYSGYEYKNKQFKLEKFQWRTGTIKAAIQEDKTVKLSEFVRFTQAEYYGQNKYSVDGGQNYAQGWSFIYFLRTGKKGGAKNWNPRWDTILEIYFKELALSGKTDKAVDAAFDGVDMDVLEASWKDYTN